MYFVKTPLFLKKLYSSYVWDVPVATKKLFLTFDDGPHPEATPFVLEELKKYKASGTFFCLGKNVIAEKKIYEQLIKEGHCAGNHTHDHLNGWKTDVSSYIKNVMKASAIISSNLFRPPYGRIKKKQATALQMEPEQKFKIIMWDVLSGDFDTNLNGEKCLDHVIKKSESGSIIVFHDSAKAFKALSYALPRVLDFFSEQGYRFEAINTADLK